MKLFNLRIEIHAPFDYFKALGCIHGRLGKHTAWELEHNYYSGSFFDFDTSYSIREDHAGFNFTIGIFGYGVGFRIYDTRHWNYGGNCYEQYKDITV
jgi:hypothetical protein